MIEYILIVLAGFAVGLIDYIIKGVIEWKNLKDFLRGTTWHLTITFLYILVIIALAYANGRPLLLAGILGVINEDFSYWICHRIHKGFWKVKPPFNLELWFYYFYLVVINGTLLILFEVFNG